MITIDLPVKKYLKKYLIIEYGESLCPTRESFFGILVNSVLQKKKYLYEYKEPKEQFNATYPININLSDYGKDGCWITHQHLYYIQKGIDEIFIKNLFTQAILNKHNFNINYKETIISLLETYGIEESELSYSTIRKKFNRAKGGLMDKLGIKAA